MQELFKKAAIVKLALLVGWGTALALSAQAADKAKPKASLAEQVAASAARARLKCPEAFEFGTEMQSAMSDVAFHYDRTKPGWRNQGNWPEQLIEFITHHPPPPEWHGERAAAQ